MKAQLPDGKRIVKSFWSPLAAGIALGLVVAPEATPDAGAAGWHAGRLWRARGGWLHQWPGLVRRCGVQHLGLCFSGCVFRHRFAFALENAGFGSPAKLTEQFRLTDWSVFKVMFTAIVVAAVGLWGMRVVGLFIGTTAFAGFYGDAIRSLMAIGEMIDGDTFADVYGIADPVMLGIMATSLVGIFYLGSWFERRGPGPVTAEQAVAGAE